MRLTCYVIPATHSHISNVSSKFMYEEYDVTN